jgi:hypothetical protein
MFSLKSPSSLQKEIMSLISISVCNVLKNKKPPSSYGVVLSYVNALKTSPPPTSGNDYTIVVEDAWDGMIEADEILSNYNNKKDVDESVSDYMDATVVGMEEKKVDKEKVVAFESDDYSTVGYYFLLVLFHTSYIVYFFFFLYSLYFIFFSLY